MIIVKYNNIDNSKYNNIDNIDNSLILYYNS